MAYNSPASSAWATWNLASASAMPISAGEGARFTPPSSFFVCFLHVRIQLRCLLSATPSSFGASCSGEYRRKPAAIQVARRAGSPLGAPTSFAKPPARNRARAEDPSPDYFFALAGDAQFSTSHYHECPGIQVYTIFLGFDESPPAYHSLPAKGVVPQMKSGVNFASGGSGLQENTGLLPCGRPVYSMTDQLEKFTAAVQMMGDDSDDLISRSLFFISVGSNDLFEYAYPWPTPPNRNDTAFLGCLVDHYKTYLQELYAAGARKFSIVSPSLVGCCPSQRAVAVTHNNDTDEFNCFGAANKLSRQLYPMIDSMLQGLNADLDGMNYSLSDSVGMAQMVFASGGKAVNLTVVDTACCAGTGRFGVGQCNTSAKLCPNRDDFMFWDGFHPTEEASFLAAIEIFGDTGKYLHPMNVRQLAAL
ncbi:hypothetical protein VPH35_039077 [Triticum aestivum]|uniref:GDSL esterase/lipase At1g33811-like n=1 Tax=Triticum aestivum TaxID=4565 RepID=UPI001D00F832|nr:GDSL esterase/lipase At1g33811-like [Triticum aestivum]